MWVLRRCLHSPTRFINSQRHASYYPFPQTKSPTPHQIFHLPQSASPADVKARYFELVRIYHPDSAAVRAQRIPDEVAHARFRAIGAAYDALRGKKPNSEEEPVPSGAGRPRAAGRSVRPDLYPAGDDRWKDKLILGGVVLTIGLFVAQTASTRRQAMQDAVARAQQHKKTNVRDEVAKQRDEQLLASRIDR